MKEKRTCLHQDSTSLILNTFNVGIWMAEFRCKVKVHGDTKYELRKGGTSDREMVRRMQHTSNH